MRRHNLIFNTRQRLYVAVAMMAFSTIALLGLLLGCGMPYQESPVDERTAMAATGKVPAEAYLFDCKLVRDGKRTSLRLEVFQTDFALALGGRAYLGKGALKGRLTADSLTVYFPTRKEFVDEAIYDVMASSACPFSLGDIDILRLFRNLPDSLELGRQIRVVSNYEKRKRPTFYVSMEGCLWQIKLTYDLQPDGWRIRKFSYTDGERLSLRASRREYRASARVKASKFFVRVPPGAVRIVP